MGLIRLLPLPARLPLIRSALAVARALREPGWPKGETTIRPGPLIVSGFLGEALGVGRAGEATAAALEAAGYPVERQSLRPAFARLWKPGPKPPVSERPGGVWIIHANAPETEVALMAHDPVDWGGRYRIGYWAWETTEAPPEWTRVATWLDEIWVPSTFVAEAVGAALDKAGLSDEREKLRVMPHPVRAPDGVTARPERFGLKSGVRHAVVMFDGRSAFARKNPWGAIEAWTRAFPEPRADACLIVKGVALSTDPGSGQRLRALAALRPDIRIYEERLDGQDLWDLLASVDVLISTHRAEGFGLVAAEAMTLGKPVIATGWSGVTDFMDETSAVLLPSRLVPVRDGTGAYRTGQWAEPDIDAAAVAIRDLFEHPDRRRALGAAGPARIAALCRAWHPETLSDMPFASFLDKSARSPAP